MIRETRPSRDCRFVEAVWVTVVAWIGEEVGA
jgi:hypothetical protein